MEKIEFNNLKSINKSLDKFAGSEHPDVKEWIIAIDKLLLERNCKIKFKYYGRGGTLFDFYSKKAKARVCRIYIGNTLGYFGKGCTLNLQGNHFATPYSIVNELPEDILYVLRNSRNCRPCRDPRKCAMTGKYYEFSLGDKQYLCCGDGFKYVLNGQTPFDLFTKWVKNELQWSENDSLLYPEKVVQFTEEDGSYAKRWAKRQDKSDDARGELSIFEQTNKEQALEKPPIEAVRDHFLIDEESNANMTRLIEFLRNSGVELKWKAKNKYVFRHNKAELIYFRIEGLNDFNISLRAINYENKDDYQDFTFSLPADKKQKFVSIDEFHCHECNEVCDKRVAYDMPDKQYVLCSSKTYVCENPPQEKLDEIEWLISIGKEYIDFKNAKKKKSS